MSSLRLAPVLAALAVFAALTASDDGRSRRRSTKIRPFNAHALHCDPAKLRRLADDPMAITGRALDEKFSKRLRRGYNREIAAALAGTALGDLFVVGDIRDLTREGIHAARGEPVDELVVGLAAVGVAITAGTYATLGLTIPLRAGLTLIKVAARTGRMSIDFTMALGRMLRRAVVDGSESTVTVRAARETVKIERAGGANAIYRRRQPRRKQSRYASRA